MAAKKKVDVEEALIAEMQSFMGRMEGQMSTMLSLAERYVVSQERIATAMEKIAEILVHETSPKPRKAPAKRARKGS